MKKATINLSAQICLEYDPGSEEFKESLRSYKEIVDDNGDEEKMLENIAYNVGLFGIERMVEGIGYVAYEDRNKPDGWCGITIVDSPDFDLCLDGVRLETDIEEIEEI